jgi:cobalt/nickel transport system permease protein
MHISEGILSTEVLVAGGAAAALGTAIGLAKMDYDRIPKVSVLSSVFFVASLVHVPVGPASEHLILNGLMGILLGWASFPAILVALFLQAVLFQYGGLTTLGVNTFNMAAPAVLCYYLFGWATGRFKAPVAIVFGFLGGSSAVLVAAVLVGAALIITAQPLQEPAFAIVVFHIPVMAVEGVLTAAVVSFLRKVKPEMLGVSNAKSPDSA